MKTTKLNTYKNFFYGKSFNYSFISDDLKDERKIDNINNIKGNKMTGGMILWYNDGFILISSDMLDAIMTKGEYKDSWYQITLA